MSAAQMAQYTALLQANTPYSSRGKQVTEVCVFKLLPKFAAHRESAAAEFESSIIANTKPGSLSAKGIRRLAWGFSENNPKALIWLLEWDKIEDHWDFWQSPGYPPVIGAIEKLFEPGRPLVRHIDFGMEGPLADKIEAARVLVWDDSRESKNPGNAVGSASAMGAQKVFQGYAVDMEELTWFAAVLTYAGLEKAKAAEAPNVDGAESHIVLFQYI